MYNRWIIMFPPSWEEKRKDLGNWEKTNIKK